MTAPTAAPPRGRVRLGSSFSLLWGGEGVSLLGAATTSLLDAIDQVQSEEDA